MSRNSARSIFQGSPNHNNTIGKVNTVDPSPLEWNASNATRTHLYQSRPQCPPIKTKSTLSSSVRTPARCFSQQVLIVALLLPPSPPCDIQFCSGWSLHGSPTDDCFAATRAAQLNQSSSSKTNLAPHGCRKPTTLDHKILVNYGKYRGSGLPWNTSGIHRSHGDSCL